MGNYYLISFIFLSIFFYNQNFLIAQFNFSQLDLIRTTAYQTFDKNILTKYIASDDSNDVIAALLSISHSEDTTFFTLVTKPDFNKYGKWISFALGQIGESEVSKKFL